MHLKSFPEHSLARYFLPFHYKQSQHQQFNIWKKIPPQKKHTQKQLTKQTKQPTTKKNPKTTKKPPHKPQPNNKKIQKPTQKNPKIKQNKKTQQKQPQNHKPKHVSKVSRKGSIKWNKVPFPIFTF